MPDEYQLSNVENQYIGTYIPVDVENHLRKNKLFYKALAIGSNFHHDILLLEKTECYSDAGFHDGYAITAEEFKNYRFVKNNNGILRQYGCRIRAEKRNTGAETRGGSA